MVTPNISLPRGSISTHHEVPTGTTPKPAWSDPSSDTFGLRLVNASIAAGSRSTKNRCSKATITDSADPVPPDLDDTVRFGLDSSTHDTVIFAGGAGTDDETPVVDTRGEDSDDDGPAEVATGIDNPP